MSSSSLFQSSSDKPVAIFSNKRKSSRESHPKQEALAKLSEMEYHSRILLEEQRSQIHSEAIFEFLLQETRAERAVDSIQKLRSQLRFQDTEI